MAEDVFRIVGSIQAGSFRVEQPVAEGGFAVVYRAFHSGFRGHVALKCLKIPDEMSREQRARFLEKFRTEAELLFRLSAAIPEIVRPLQIHLLDMPDGRFVPFLALEWLEGEPLDRIIDRRTSEGKPPLSLREVVPLLTPIARALSRAHAFPNPAGGGTVAVVHCDLKPENIFVAQAGGEQQLKLVDFGIATARTAATQAAMEDEGGMIRPSSPSSTAMAFSPQYAAPEQWAPSEFGTTGPWTDVYGLALTVVEAVIGRPALSGEVAHIRAAALDTNVRPTPARFGFQLGQKTDRILERALAVQPRMRFQKISEFWGELEQAIGMPPSLKGTSGVWDLGGERRERERAHRELVLDQPVERLDLEIESVPSVRPKMPAAQPGEMGNVIGGAPPPKLAVDLALDHGPISTRSGRFARPDLTPLVVAPRTPLPPPPSGVTMSIPAAIGAAALVSIGVLLFFFATNLGVPSLAGIAPIAGAVGLVVWQLVSRRLHD